MRALAGALPLLPTEGCSPCLTLVFRDCPGSLSFLGMNEHLPCVPVHITRYAGDMWGGGPHIAQAGHS